jgi:hypothetical protein
VGIEDEAPGYMRWGRREREEEQRFCVDLGIPSAGQVNTSRLVE